MKELDRIKKEYIENVDFRYTPDYCKKMSRKILDYIYKSNPFEKPDFYFYDGKTCYLFEHFEFDASMRMEKCGSVSRRNLHIAHRQIDQTWKDVTSNIGKINEIQNHGVMTRTVENHVSKEAWKDNFCNYFDTHCSKIKDYQEHIEEKLKKKVRFINCFVIEDSTELGGLFHINWKKHKVFVSQFDFAVQKMNKAKNINYFIYLNKADCFCRIISRYGLNRLKRKPFDYDKTDVIFFNQTHVLSACFSIPNQ